MLFEIISVVLYWQNNLCLFVCLFQQNLPQSVIENVGGKIFTFGSYRLGVHTKGKYCFNLTNIFLFLKS